MNATAAANYLGLDRFLVTAPSIDLKYVVPGVILLVIVNRVLVYFQKLKVRLRRMFDEANGVA